MELRPQEAELCSDGPQPFEGDRDVPCASRWVNGESKFAVREEETGDAMGEIPCDLSV